MAHMLDFTKGRAAIAYAGETPWHGFGTTIDPNDDLDTIQAKAGLDFEAKLATVQYDREVIDLSGGAGRILLSSKNDRVLYRSDTGDVLGIVSDRYRPVQPKQIVQFFRDLFEKHGFTMETAGALREGKRIWALAKCGKQFSLKGQDVNALYLLAATSFDGSMSTQVRRTGVRVVCNNTIEIAVAGKADITVPHSTNFDADKVKLELQIGDAWEAYQANAERLVETKVDGQQTLTYLLDVYLGLTNRDEVAEAMADEAKKKQIDKLITRLEERLKNAPGSNLRSAQGTAWGLINAVTNDVDFTIPARNQGNRLNSAWFGPGNSIKQKAWAKALAIAA